MRICVIRHYYFPLDPRVRREVEALSSAGHSVDVICLRQPGERRRERLGRVTVWRLPMRHRRGSLARWLYEYAAFTIMAGLLAGALCVRRRFDLVQVNTVPDTLVFAAVIPKLLGVPVLLDLHECMPEFLATTFELDQGHPAVRAIAACEQASIRFADFAITCTEDMRDVFVARGAQQEKIAIIMNSADETVFSVNGRSPRRRDDNELRLLQHGSIEPRYGIDTAIRAVASVRGRVPAVRLMIYGAGSQRDELMQLVAELGVEREVSFSDGFVPLDELVEALASCDAGVVAIKRDRFRDLTHCNKMFDLISMRRPVLCSRTRSVMRYFPDSCFSYFESDDHEDLARAIEELANDPERGERMVQRAAEISEPYRWPRQEARYLEIVRALAAHRSSEHEALSRISLAAPDYANSTEDDTTTENERPLAAGERG